MTAQRTSDVASRRVRPGLPPAALPAAWVGAWESRKTRWHETLDTTRQCRGSSGETSQATVESGQ